MSIVVTCECTMTYRLPDRYAGKRCRCRECGGRIRVPREDRSRTSGEAARRARRAKRAKAQASREAAQRLRREERRRAERRRARVRVASKCTTRRLDAQDRDILSDRQALRDTQPKKRRAKRRAISESMHQLAPMRSGDRLDRHVGLTPSPGRAKRRRARRDRDASDRRTERMAAPEKARLRKRARAKAAAKAKTKTAKTKTAKTKTAKTKTAKRKGPKKGTKARAERAERIATGRPVRKKTRTYRRGVRASGDGDEETRPKRKSAAGQTTHALYAVLAIVGVFCLGIGLVVGGVFSGNTTQDTSALDKKLSAIEKMKEGRNWDHAKLAVEALKLELEVAKDQVALDKLYAVSVGVDKMVQILALEDENQRLTVLVEFCSDPDPTVRLSCAWELRQICEQEDAQRALVNLTNDPDKRVAVAARQAMVQAGGPLSVPFLMEAVVQSAASGGKQGDVALARAIEVDDPAVLPVLLKILELRPKAPASALRQVINRIGEYGDPSAVSAVKPFTTHEDPELAEIAQAVVEELGG